MRKLLFLLVLCCALPAFSQVRWDIGSPGGSGVTSISGSGQPFLIAQPNVTLNFCAYPANTIPCTNFAPTYTDLTLSTQCPSNAQIVLQGSNTCQATSDSYGNLGVYTNAGSYSYTLTVGSVSFGPFTLTLGGGGSGPGSTVQGTPNQINVTLSNPQIASLANPTSFPGAVSIPGSQFTLAGNLPGQGYTSDVNGLTVQTSAPINVGPFTVGIDPCDKIAKGFTQLPSAGNGVVDARGLGSGNLTPCSAATAHAMFNSATSGYVLLPNATFWIPLATSAAATSTLPSAGVIPLPNKFVGLVGAGRGDASTSLGTTFAVCKGTNNPVTGCVAPATREWTITSTTITRAGGRTYLGINVSGADLVAGEPVRIRASNTTDNNGPFRICNINVANSTRTDASCPANPTSSLIYVPTNSGLTGVTISGSGTGYTTACTVSGGGGTGATCLAAVSGGNVTGITIIDPGTGYTSVPTIAVASGSGQTFTAKIATACASTCGTLSGEIPVFDLTPLTGNQFAQRLINISVDGEGVNDVTCFRSLSGNEQSGLDHFKCSGAPERGIDVHTFTAQNMDTLRSLELYTGSSCGASCTTGTVGAFFGDVGPHGMTDWTVNFGNSTHTHMAGIILDVNTDPINISTGHCENTQKCVLIGWGAPGQAIKVDSVAGGPTSQCADTGCVPTDGPFQNGQSSVVTIVKNYVTGSPFTRDWIFLNLFRVNATDILEDWVNTTVGTNDHISNQNSMMFYSSDTTAGGVTNTETTDASIRNQIDGLDVTTSVTSPLFTSTGTNGGMAGTEGTGASVLPAAGSGVDQMFPDSTSHCWHQNLNNVDYGCVPRTIASGAKTLNTTAVSSATCGTVQTATATGTLTTDRIVVNFNGDPTAVTGYVPLTAGMLTIIVYPTADTVNIKVCNNTSSSITPGAVTLNWSVIR